MNILIILLSVALGVVIWFFILKPLFHDLFIKSGDTTHEFSDFSEIFTDLFFELLVRFPQNEDEPLRYVSLDTYIIRFPPYVSFLYSHIVIMQNDDEQLSFFVPRFNRIAMRIDKQIQICDDYGCSYGMRQTINNSSNQQVEWEGTAHTKEQGKAIFREILRRAGETEFVECLDNPDESIFENATGIPDEEINH